MKQEIFQGETAGFKIRIKNEPEDAEIKVAFVYGNHLIAKYFSKNERTLFKENDCYICELSQTDTKSMGASHYFIEVKIEAAAGVIIKQVGELIVKRNQVYKI